MAHAKRAVILLPADRKGFAIKSAHHFQVRRPKSAEAGAATKSAQNPDLMQRRRLDAACGVPDTEGALGRRLTTPASGLQIQMHNPDPDLDDDATSWHIGLVTRIGRYNQGPAIWNFELNLDHELDWQYYWQLRTADCGLRGRSCLKKWSYRGY
jgi:hypothetical protein